MSDSIQPRTDLSKSGKQCREVVDMLGETCRYCNQRFCFPHGAFRDPRSLPGIDGCLQQSVSQTSDGSFSAVWTATIASKDAFFCIFRDLQSPLRAIKTCTHFFFARKKRTFGEGRPSQAGWVQVGPWKAGGGYQRLTLGERWGNLGVTLG